MSKYKTHLNPQDSYLTPCGGWAGHRDCTNNLESVTCVKCLAAIEAARKRVAKMNTNWETVAQGCALEAHTVQQIEVVEGAFYLRGEERKP